MSASPTVAGGLLHNVGLHDFRCFEGLEVSPGSGLNILSGANGAGKTSFLEALFFLSRGRSFRAGDWRTICRQGAAGFEVHAAVQAGARLVRIGLARSAEQQRARLDGQPAASQAELAAVLPVLLIDPHSHLLIEGGPSLRRQFLDWGVFHVEQRGVADWRRYRRALRQRNALLRQGGPLRSLAGWNEELASAGMALDAGRRAFLASYVPVLQSLLPELLGETVVELRYRAGWPESSPLREALQEALESDRSRGVTSVGPHRAELGIRWDGVPAQERVSRGQQKLLAAALLLAQAQLYGTRHPRSCLLLIDDPVAELDRGRLEQLLEFVAGLPAQALLTCVDPMPLMRAVPEAKRFHVEQGAITEMV